MFFGAVRTIALTGLFIPLAGEFITAMNAIAISRRGSSLDRHQSHSASLRLRILPVQESSRKANAHLQRLVISERDRKFTRVRVASGGRDPRFSRAARSTGCPAGPGTLRQHAGRIACPRSGEFHRAQRNLLAAQPAWIARSVIALLVRENDLGSLLQKRNALQHGKSNVAVSPHDLTLFRS